MTDFIDRNIVKHSEQTIVMKEHTVKDCGWNTWGKVRA